MGWDKNSIANKAKAVCASRAKPGIQLYFSIGRQMLSLTQENRIHRAVFFWNDKCWHSKCSPSSFFAPAFIVEHNAIWYGTSLWPVWVSCPVCVPSRLLVVFIPLLAGQHKQQKSPWISTALLSNNYNISVLSPLFWSKIQNVMAWASAK